jgi:hypothetical protein
MTTSSSKPKLAQLKTPVTSTFPSQLSATFPSELSATSAKSPFPGFVDFIKLEDGTKTPITPPTAYIDFLKSMSMASPLNGEKRSGILTPTSAPSDASSEHSNCSCHCETHKSPTSAVLPSPFAYPISAPSSARLSRIRIPSSPAYSAKDSPLSAGSTMRSPFSARSPYEWEVANKRKSLDVLSPKTSRSGVRHVREIVTRTVTYTPRMSAAPKGKRRKIE